MSTSRDSYCLPSVKEQKHDFQVFAFNVKKKTIIRFGFCDIQNNQGLGKGYQPQPSAEANNPYLDLDYSGYHKSLIQKWFSITRCKQSIIQQVRSVSKPNCGVS